MCVMEYEVVIGLEIHAELATKSKMFCSCKNDPDETRPNTNICPVCLAHPGTLPVANMEAVKKVVLVGLALGADIADVSQFDRKNYFYPDLPKGYQISQYEHPIVKNGAITLASGKKIRITRGHTAHGACDGARSSECPRGALGGGRTPAYIPICRRLARAYGERGDARRSKRICTQKRRRKT